MSHHTTHVETDEVKEVREAVEKFYEALNQMLGGNPEPFKALWLHSDDVTYMGANGSFQVGWEAVFADWKAQAEKSLSGTAVPSNVRVAVRGNSATACSYTKGEVKHEDGSVEKVSIRESSVFCKENGEWKMISHHADALPIWRRIFSPDA